MKKLLKGLRRDERPSDQPEGTWRDARNIVVYKQFGAISNENGVQDITPTAQVVGGIQYHNFPTGKIVIGTIPTNVETVYFFGGTGLYDSEIGLLNKDGLYRTILKDDVTASILHFDINYPIKGTFEYKYNNELIVAFTDNYNYPRILNINCIPFNVSTTGIIAATDIEKASQLLQQFPNMKTPLIQDEGDLKVISGSGALKSGSIYLTISYELADGTSTFWCKVFNPIPIYADSTALTFEKVGGSIAGTSTNKSIEVTFKEVDTNFKFLKVGYIFQQNGVTTAYYNSKKLIDGTTISMIITGNESTQVEIPVDEVLIPNAVYTKCVGITNLQGRLYEANLEQDEDINLQPIANEVVVKWVREKDISLNSRVLNTYTSGTVTAYGSFKDPSVVFFNKSFKDGECYALYLVGKSKNGLYTRAFHIPGREVTAGDRTALNGTSAEIDAIAPSGVKKFQIQDTTLATGEMGAWENETEEYPLDITGTAIHPDYVNVPGITLANRKVRHHVFPDLRTLKGYGENYQKVIANVTCTYNGVAPGGYFLNPDREHLVLFYLLGAPTTCFHVGASGNATRIDAFTRSGIFTLSVDFQDLIAGVDADRPGSCVGIDDNVSTDGPNKVYLDWVLKKNGAPIVTYHQEQTEFQNTGNFPSGFTPTVFNINVAPGDVIEIEYLIYVSTNNNAAGLAFQISDHTLCFETNVVMTFNARDLDTEVLGIEVSNLNIPQNIAEKLDTWEIFYAKRTETNIRIVAQDMIKDKRYHNFDLISTQVVAQAKYLKPQLKYTGTSITGQLFDTINIPNIEAAFPTEEVKVINSFQYCGENTSLPQPNANRAINICIIAGVGETNADLIQTQYGDTNTLTDICIYKTNMYAPFDTQDLLSTGYAFKITTGGLQATKKVYGGDIHINIFGFRPYLNNENHFLLTCGSASNIGLRHDELAVFKQYYPKFNVATPSYYGYNKDYNCTNGLTELIIHGTNGNCNTDKIAQFHQRVIYSIVDPNENRFLNWRIFKILDYYEMPKNKGKITSLLGADRKLFIHHEYSLFLAEIKDSIATATGDIYLKSSNIFDRPPIEILPINEGFAGNQSHFATIYCKLGYCFIDRNAKKVFIYDGQLKEISKNGLFNFFKEYAENTLINVDNPYINNGYMMAYDGELDRLLITKNDASGSFTLSFCENSWISFHNYHPNSLIYNRTGLIAVSNILNKVFKHNNPLVKCIYYSGVVKDSYVEVVFNPAPDISKTVRSINWLSDTVKSDGTVLKDETITHLLIYNNSQCSGLIDINKDKGLWFGSDARNVEDTWNFNDFRDLIKDKNLPFLDNKNELIQTNINTSKAWFDKSLFISKFAIVRFIHNNVNQHDVHIIGVNVTFKKSDRV